MITKKQLLSSIAHEIEIVKHLYRKLKPEQFEYRPLPNMRSTLELLQYLTYNGVVTLKFLSTNNPDIFKAYDDEAKKLTAGDIPEALDKQLAEIRSTLGNFTEDELNTREAKFPWGPGGLFGEAIMNTSLKFMTAYRMQLFLYAKMSGYTELDTMDCWQGSK